MSSGVRTGVKRTSGWVVFAGVITGLVGALNLIYGLTLLLKDEWVVLSPEAIVRFDLTTVGVVYLIFAAFTIFVAIGIFDGALWARVLGIIGASLNLVAQATFLSVYPAWSFIIIVINGFIIYGLAVHGDEIAEF